MTIDERNMSDKDDNKGSIVGKREILEKALFLYTVLPLPSMLL
jgi:hypothetical protein